MLHWFRSKFFKNQTIATSECRERDQITSGSNSNLPSSSPMVMRETNNLKEKIQLSIVKEGEIFIIKVACSLVISELIIMAISHFLDPSEAHNLSRRYKLILVHQMKNLNCHSTVGEELLKDKDELLLVPIMIAGDGTKKLSIEDIKGPSEEEIKNATSNLLSKHPVQVIPSLDCQENFQSEIRKVLYSLVEASANIIATNPDANAIFNEIVARITANTNKEIDENAVKFLKDMGFTEAQARYALRLKRNRQVESLEWLVENSEHIKDVDIERTNKPLSQLPNDSEMPISKIKTLLSDIREFQHRFFEASPRALENLLEMGFISDEIVEALRITDNNQLAACEWLCGERGPDVTNPPFRLDSEGQLYKALMKNPSIQLGLNNPKVLFALVSILDNASSANLWLNDVDVAPVLGHVFKTYHSEKHIILAKEQLVLMRRRQAQS